MSLWPARYAAMLSMRLSCAVVCGAVLAVDASPRAPMLTPELYISLRAVEDVALSPRGDEVLYTVSRPREQGEGPGPRILELWARATHEREATRVAPQLQQFRSLSYSPDGKSRAWIARESSAHAGSASQDRIHIQGRDDAALRVFGAGSVQRFSWSRDGTRIAYTATDRPSKAQIEARAQGRDWIEVHATANSISLRILDLASGATRIVTPQALSVHEFDWSPDGRELVFTAAPSPSMDDELLATQLYTVPTEGGEPVLLATPPSAPVIQPRYSPDGRWIAWLCGSADGDPVPGTLSLLSRASREVRRLNEHAERTPIAFEWWPGAPSALLVHAIEAQSSAFYMTSISGETQPMTLLDGAEASGHPKFSADGKTVAIRANSVRHPNEVYLWSAREDGRRLTDSNPQLAELEVGRQEIVHWKSPDGLQIEGVLTLPLDHRPGARFPTVVQVHGGPESACEVGWGARLGEAWVQMLAARGFAVLCPNYRGSLGRGTAFHIARGDELLLKSHQDIAAGLEHLVRTGVADPNRLGIAGYSWGGLAAAWGATHDSSRYGAAVVIAGVSNWVSLIGTSRSGLHEQIAHWDRRLHEDNYLHFLERSAVFHARKASTPTLIMHGMEDEDVPVNQARELYAALRWKKVPVELVLYPREGHGISEQTHQLDVLQRTVDWFVDRLSRSQSGN